MRSHVPLLALASALILAAGVRPSPAKPAPRPPSTSGGLAVSSFTLDNGLTVVLHEDHAIPTVMVMMWYRVGSKDEHAGKTGFAHLFEHLMFKGSKHVPDGMFDELLENAGGWNNGTTSADRTNYFEEVPSNQLELALYLEADRMAGLWEAMDQKVLDNQRDVVKNERRQSYEDQPYGLAELMVQQALWPPGHGNHNLTIGTMEDLTAASLADVEAFYRSYYVPNNAILVIGGDLDPVRTRALVSKYFGWMPRRADPPHVELVGVVEPLRGARELTTTDDVQATKVMMAWRSPTPFTRGSRDLEVAAQLLAGGKSSRLNQTLVFERRLADSVIAYQNPEMLGGEMRIEVIARKDASIAEIRKVIDAELTRLATEPPSASELERARRIMEADTIESLQSLYRRVAQLAEYQAYTGTADHFAADLAMLRATTAAGVRDAVRTWLRLDARVVITVTPGPKVGADQGGAR
ncbi:MAG TPA: pitrilysin family protein [Kofleriaceae bacterium]|nr:pitrilysin family protein [Kofleriaceae bacterium]